MSDFDDETLERELFAHRRRSIESESGAALGRTQVETRRGVADVLARVDGARRRSHRTRMFGFARVVSQAGTAFAAAAACLALVRGLPASPSEGHVGRSASPFEVRRDELPDALRVSAPRLTNGGMTPEPSSSEVVPSGASSLACGSDSDTLRSGAACEAPVVEASSTTAASTEPASFPSPIATATAPAPLACESHSCGGEVTCAGDGP